MSTEQTSYYISLQEISFQTGEFTHGFPQDSFGSVIPQEPYQGLEYYGGEGKIIMAHALEVQNVKRSFNRTKRSIKAYVVTLEHDNNRMRKITTEDMEKRKEKDMEKGKIEDKIRAQGEKALDSQNAWFQAARTRCSWDDCTPGRGRNGLKSYLPQPCYEACGYEFIESHQQPGKGVSLMPYAIFFRAIFT